MSSRRKESKVADSDPAPGSDDLLASPQDESDDSGVSGKGGRRRPRRPLLKSARFWVPISILLVLLAVAGAGALVAKHLYDQAMSAKADLEKAIPLVDQVQKDMLAGDTATARATIAQISHLTAMAQSKTSGTLWKNVEWVPVAGPNLTAVRVLAGSVNDLVDNAITPLTAINLDALMPKNGGIDVANLTALAGTIETADKSVTRIRASLDKLDRSALVAPVASGVARLDAAMAKIEPVVTPVHNALTILTKALGVNGPQHYLLIFQNNAESRGTGGNPAAIAMLTAVNGRITLTQQAGTGDFKNGRPDPIIAVNPQTVALYGTKIGRYIQDTTLSPDFSETAQIVRAFWAESFGTPVDAVASVDPVALSYVLRAIGPVTMPPPFGDVLTADDAVPLLLNQVYAKYPDPETQDAFFAAAAQSVFQALLTTHADPKALLTALTQAANEGRLMYSPSDKAQADLLAGTPVGGNMPADNTKTTDLGVYLDDVTEGKLDYYMQMGIAASSTQCQKGAAPTFRTTVTLQNTLDPGAVAGLPEFISPGHYFPRGDVSTDVYLYGPVGSRLTGVTVDGQPVSATGQPHLGRTAVKVNVLTRPGQTATVVASFDAPAGGYGPLEVRHTPMVKPTPVALDTPGCAPAKK
ncbi:DUF4012 domain-containing protein [Microbacterium sp. ASV81]|uniref:DUF4012 domain-containing protein n=1 Tax=Microbacterium capsulatum TaxID=3041921 RepID=A0ABU0XGH3_9MICO|nr:DUF4012 domain-containing protein [Microbacterium sp. ASV81]MDQ4214232.1 DUF4012 domain-containing protein [Microbacterium sp. ASV81]